MASSAGEDGGARGGDGNSGRTEGTGATERRDGADVGEEDELMLAGPARHRDGEEGSVKGQTGNQRVSHVQRNTPILVSVQTLFNSFGGSNQIQKL